MDWALGHAAVHARFAHGDLASILDHHHRGYQMVCVSEGVTDLKEFDCEHDQASEEGRCRA